jgi:hypothetical protein
MGDHPEAGRVWFLTAVSGRDWEVAEAAFYEKYGRKASNIVASLRVKGGIEDYPAAAQERLRDLQRRLREEGRFWEPRKRRSLPPRPRKRLAVAVSALVVVLFGAALGVGLYNIVLFFISALRAG